MSRGSWLLLAVGLAASVILALSAGRSSSLLTAGLTTLLGVVVFVFGQWVLKIYIEPIQEQRRIVGRVVHALRYYDRQPHALSARFAEVTLEKEPASVAEVNTDGFAREARAAFNGLSAELTANLHLIPSHGYARLARWELVKPKGDVEGAAIALVELSFWFGEDGDAVQGEVLRHVHRIQEELGISLGPREN